MTTVLLADDETTFLRAFRHRLQRIKPEYRIVGEASDGKQALNLLRQLRPDIVITDVKMPMMNGLELTERIKEEYPDTLVVILSAYSEFEFAKKALQLQADDYVLKPLASQALEDLLVRLDGKVGSIRVRKERAALGLFLRGKEMPPVEFLPRSGLQLLLACAGTYSPAQTGQGHPSYYFWNRLDAEPGPTVASAAANSFIRLDSGHENERWFALTGSAEECEREMAALTRYFREWGERLGTPVTLVTSDYYCSVRKAGQAMQAMRACIAKRQIFAAGRTLRPGEAQENEEERQFKPLIFSGITSKDKAFVQGALSEALARWSQAGVSCYRLGCLLKKTLHYLEDSCGGLSAEEADVSLFVDTLLTQSVTYGEMADELRSFVERAMSGSERDPYAASAADEGREALMRRVEAYLKEHVQESVTLKELAEAFRLAPSYLSALYKRSRGMTPGEHLTKLKMQRAKGLMEARPGMLLKEVAAEVGYEDSLYFSRVFKRVFRVPPSVWKA